MDVGIGLPNSVPGLDGRLMVDWARQAEDRGFSTLGTIDRLLFPNYEPLVALAAAAAVTERIRLMTDILISPYRNNTPLLAKQAVSLDNVSGGRLTLGVAPGWRDDDYKASGVDHAARGRILDEQLAEMTRLWRGESVDGLGGVGPAPERDGGPEIMIGGETKAAYAARRSTEVAGRWGAARPSEWSPAVRRSSRPGPTRAARVSTLTYFCRTPRRRRTATSTRTTARWARRRRT
jgi:alkanesulfonate monooxygenase SsuD/methylene tetrahydromethanopterin reductase-like flavin-dependent oxidoreductase (luciferase family)